MGCHVLLQCMKVKSEREVAQSCPTQQPHGLQPTRLLRPWDFPGKSTGVGCHRLLQLEIVTYFKWGRSYLMTAFRDLSRPVLKRYEETSHDKNQTFQKDGLWSGNIRMWIGILSWVYISDLISSVFTAYLLYRHHVMYFSVCSLI